MIETPWAGDADGRLFLTRTFEFGEIAKPLTSLIATKRGKTALLQKIGGLVVAQLSSGEQTLWVTALGQGISLAVKNDRIFLTVQPGEAKRLAKVFIVQAPLDQAKSVVALANANVVIEPPSRLAKRQQDRQSAKPSGRYHAAPQIYSSQIPFPKRCGRIGILRYWYNTNSPEC